MLISLSNLLPSRFNVGEIVLFQPNLNAGTDPHTNELVAVGAVPARIVACNFTQGKVTYDLAVKDIQGTGFYEALPIENVDSVMVLPIESQNVCNSSDTYVCSAAIAKVAAKGLELRKEFKRGGTQVGVARANQLKNRRPLSLNTIKRMYSYFKRHEVDKNSPKWNDPSAGKIAWMLWGGDPAYTWVKKVLKQNAMVSTSAKEKEVLEELDKFVQAMKDARVKGINVDKHHSLYWNVLFDASNVDQDRLMQIAKLADWAPPVYQPKSNTWRILKLMGERHLMAIVSADDSDKPGKVEFLGDALNLH